MLVFINNFQILCNETTDFETTMKTNEATKEN